MKLLKLLFPLDANSGIPFPFRATVRATFSALLNMGQLLLPDQDIETAAHLGFAIALLIARVMIVSEVPKLPKLVLLYPMCKN